MGNTKKELRLIFISDTHTFQDKISVPDGDILIHSGDYTFTGTIPEVNGFMTWFAELPHKHKIVVNGNHERTFFQNPTLFKSLIPRKVIYLEDDVAIVEGLKFYGNPYTKAFGDWAYMYYTPEQAEAIWSRIPLDTDILVTHMPPYKIRDGAPYKVGREGLFVPSLDLDGEPVGCEVLRSYVDLIKPKVHAFGHIHEGAGYSEIDGTVFINASICNGKYKPINPATVVTLDDDKQVKRIEAFETSKGFTTVDKRR